MKKKVLSKKVKRTIISLIPAVALIAFMLISFHVKKVRDIEEMNDRELHYDANGKFVMVCVEDELCGIYDGRNPLKHIGCKVSISPETPEVYIVSDLPGFTSLTEWEMSEIRRLVTAKTPVIVYKN